MQRFSGRFSAKWIENKALGNVSEKALQWPIAYGEVLKQLVRGSCSTS